MNKYEITGKFQDEHSITQEVQALTSNEAIMLFTSRDLIQKRIGDDSFNLNELVSIVCKKIS